jgi:hypothetical protein
MEWWRLALDYLKVLIWPALWLTLALLFRDSIRAFVQRLRSFEGAGLKLSAIEGAEIAEAKVDEALKDSDPAVRQAVDNAFEDARVTLQAVDEPWTLEHFSGDAYLITNRTGAVAYDVEFDAGDFITRGDKLLPRVGPGQKQKLLLLRTMATASDSVTVKWSSNPSSPTRRNYDLFVPPRPR